MLDRCTPRHAARVVPRKDEDTLMQAIDELWVSTHGAPKELIVDRESGIAVSEKSSIWHVKAQNFMFVQRTNTPSLWNEEVLYSETLSTELKAKQGRKACQYHSLPFLLKPSSAERLS